MTMTHKSHKQRIQEKYGRINSDKVIDILKSHLELLYVLILFFIVFIFFTRSFGEGIKLFFGFIIIAIIPGMLISQILLKNLSMLEKALISGFLGIWIIPLLMYYASFFDMKSVTSTFTVITSVICLTAYILLVLFEE